MRGTICARYGSWFPVAWPYRKDIRPGLRVAIIRKQDQRTGKRTIGVAKDILTSAPRHTCGIKVRLEDGQIGRGQGIAPEAGA